MDDITSPTSQAMAEALTLSTEILRNIELGEIPLENIALKTTRLARLLNDLEMEEILRYEVGGYPTTENGISPDIWRLGSTAKRTYVEVDRKTEEPKTYMYMASISQLESKLEADTLGLSIASDPDISLGQAAHYIKDQFSNQNERIALRSVIASTAKQIAERKSFIYSYTLQKHYELKFSGIADDIFTRIRFRVDEQIGTVVPSAIRKFSAIYDNLASENPEDWANAVHSCRRILQELANALFPPQATSISKVVDGKAVEIKLGEDQYINRIMAFVERNNTSSRFQQIVGSHLNYLGERLDSVFKAAQKGSHGEIITKQEADRYVVYTYLLVGDILSLSEGPE
jgi:hypothetical protein